MRIIAGERRGHKIDGPKGQGTRPTSDLVRESVFNILRDAVVDRIVVDLFAGTGALGLEALSRGAARAIFVERNRENVGLIYRNLATLRYEDRVRVLATDAYRWARSFTPVDEAPMVVMIDPPYRDYESKPGRVRQMLNDLITKLPAGSLIVLEAGRTVNEDLLPGLDAWDVRRYGGTQLAIRTVSAGDADGKAAQGEAASETGDGSSDHAVDVVEPGEPPHVDRDAET
jgi:16S rRNA (guanine966-N2)-methyltransferase